MTTIILMTIAFILFFLGGFFTGFLFLAIRIKKRMKQITNITKTIMKLHEKENNNDK